MGQYHAIYNIDKKEFIHPHRLNCGLKLLEYSSTIAIGLALLLSNSNGRGGGDLYIDHEYDKKTLNKKPLKGQKRLDQMAIDEVSGRWAGDRIVVQGDYAEIGDPAFQDKDTLESYKDISDKVSKALCTDKYLCEQLGYQEK